MLIIVLNLSLSKNIFKTKKQKKKKAILTRRTGEKTKRKRNKSPRVAGQTQPLGEATIFALPLCRSLLVGWCGGCPTYICYLFVHFLIHSNQRKDTKNTYGISIGCFGMLSLIRTKLFKCEGALRGKFKVFLGLLSIYIVPTQAKYCHVMPN